MPRISLVPVCVFIIGLNGLFLRTCLWIRDQQLFLSPRMLLKEEYKKNIKLNAALPSAFIGIKTS